MTIASSRETLFSSINDRARLGGLRSETERLDKMTSRGPSSCDSVRFGVFRNPAFVFNL